MIIGMIRCCRQHLSDSGADLLIYGMGERQIVEIADALAGGLPAEQITYVNGTCYMTHSLERVYEYETIESYEAVARDKKAYAAAFMGAIPRTGCNPWETACTAARGCVPCCEPARSAAYDRRT